MKNLIEKLGIKAEYVLSREQLKQITGGVLYCRCHGSVGCWVYPTGSPGGGYPSGPRTAADITKYCESGAGYCAERDICVNV